MRPMLRDLGGVQLRLQGAVALAGAASRVLRFTFATADVARDGHRILPGAWDLAAFNRNPVFAAFHDDNRPPVGRVVEIAERNGKLTGAVQFAETPDAEEIFQLYKSGAMSAVSVGFTPLEGKRATGAGRAPGAFDFSSVELLEISAVVVGSDRGAVIERAFKQKDQTMPVISLPKSPAAPRAARFDNLGHFAQAVVRAATGLADCRLVRAPTGASEADPISAGFLVPEAWAPDIVESLYGASPMVKLCARHVGSLPVKFPAIDEKSRVDGGRWGGVLAGWSSEAATISPTLPKWRLIDFLPQKLIGATYVTAELLADAPALDASLRRMFAAELSLLAERAILHGNGVGQPFGILNSPALITVPKDSGQAAGTISTTNVAAMWSRMPLTCRANAVWIVNEDALAQLDAGNYTGIFQPAGSDGIATPRLKGRPVIEIENASPLGTPGDILLLDLSQYLVAGPDPDIAVSLHVAFVSDEAVFRFAWRVEGRPLWTSPITPFNGTATRSPFVALAAR
jgi:HK97 family phage major capsid protein/HK97 family phage prohead protease